MKIQWRPNAFYEVRSLPSVQAQIRMHAGQIASRAGEGFAWSDRQGRKNPQGRWRAIVYPDSFSAKARNARDNALVRALG